MRVSSRWNLCVFSLVVVTGVAYERAQSQVSAVTAATPFSMREVAYLKASNPEAGDHFGCGGHLPGHAGNSIAVSADGTTLAVGAPHESSGARGINGDQNDNSVYSSGAVYVFTRQGGNWVQQAYVKASNPGDSDNFGSNVVLSDDGNTMAVSAYWESSGARGVHGNQDDESLPQAGAVYVFTRQGNTWSQQAYLKASNTGRYPDPGDPTDFGDGDQFGYAIALSGDGSTLAVGALAEDSTAASINNWAFQDDDSAPDAGAVYIFRRNGSIWTQTDYLKSSNNEAGDRFGFAVALNRDGTTLAVGAYDEDGSGWTVNAIPDDLRNGTGAIYAFVYENGAWRQQAYLKGSQLNRNDASGVSVAISADGNTIVGGTADDTCLVPGIKPYNPNGPWECRGATWPPHLGAGTAGGAYVWVRDGERWAEQAYIKTPNPELEDLFGVHVALSADGNTLAVSAPMEDARGQGINTADPHDNSATDAGALYVFTRSGNTWTQRAYVKGSNTEEYDEFGSSLAVSADGRTIVVGARIEASAAAGVNADKNDNSAQGAGAAYVFAVD